MAGDEWPQEDKPKERWFEMNGLKRGGLKEVVCKEWPQEGRPRKRWFEMSGLKRKGLKRGGLK